MDIEKIAAEEPKKIVTTKISFKDKVNAEDIEKIIKPFNFTQEQKNS